MRLASDLKAVRDAKNSDSPRPAATAPSPSVPTKVPSIAVPSVPAQPVWLDSLIIRDYPDETMAVVVTGQPRWFHRPEIPPPLQRPCEYSDIHFGHRGECVRRLHAGGVGVAHSTAVQ
jgi:hypothetical protein